MCYGDVQAVAGYHAPHSAISCSDGQPIVPEMVDRVRVFTHSVSIPDGAFGWGKLMLLHGDHSDHSDTTQSTRLLSPN
jgi:hypothetical protein